MFTVENEHCLYVLLLHCCDLPGENEHDLYCCCTAVTYLVPVNLLLACTNNMNMMLHNCCRTVVPQQVKSRPWNGKVWRHPDARGSATRENLRVPSRSRDGLEGLW